jgi:hypothetical protein
MFGAIIPLPFNIQATTGVTLARKINRLDFLAYRFEMLYQMFIHLGQIERAEPLKKFLERLYMTI